MEMQFYGRKKTRRAKTFFQPMLRQAVGIGLLAAAVFLLPGRSEAQFVCPDNHNLDNPPTVPNPLHQTPATQCVVSDLAQCGAKCPGFSREDVSCGAPGPTNCCWDSLDDAVNWGQLGVSEPGRVIAVFGPVNEDTTTHSLTNCNIGTNNVVISRGTGSNQCIFPPIPIQIEECKNAKILPGDPALPVLDILATSGDVVGNPKVGPVLINGLDVIGGAEGVRVGTNGTAKQPGTTLKAVRAENNIGGPVEENLTQLLGVTLNVSSSFPGFPPTRAVDDNLNTSWFTASGNACNLGNCPFFEIIFPQDVTVSQLQMFGNREFAAGFDFFSGIFQLFDASATVLFDSGVVNLPAPDRDVTLTIPYVAGVRRVRFTATADESVDPGFAELKVIGPTGAFSSGAGIEVRGNFNTVTNGTAESNDTGFLVTGNNNTLTGSSRALNNIFNGFQIVGNGNLVRGSSATSNGRDGFHVTGAGNTLQDDKANKNIDDGFQIGGVGNKLKSNASNQGNAGGSNENFGAEYRLLSPAINQGGNKADNIGIPKTSSPQKCPTFPAVGICE
jgi:hypothetical protein